MGGLGSQVSEGTGTEWGHGGRTRLAGGRRGEGGRERVQAKGYAWSGGTCSGVKYLTAIFVIKSGDH